MSGISIHALLAESDPLKRLRRKLPQISIHALLAESDGCTEAGRAGDIYFYPRSPCGERPCAAAVRHTRQNFYPRSPCGERLRRKALGIRYARFLSTLSLRRATSFGWNNNARSIFLSTLSLRRATELYMISRFGKLISIHALLAESDINTYHRIFGEGISIHALLAESDGRNISLLDISSAFLSTLSLRRATVGRAG